MLAWLRRRRIRPALADLVAAHAWAGTFSGAVLVAQEGAIILRTAAGSADRDRAVDVSPATTFRIGSVTKAVTAVAVLRLADQGRLAIDDPLGRYLPDFPRADRIRLRHLLSNTSGIPDYLIDEGFHPHCHEPHAPERLLDYVRGLPALGEPGASLSYSNTNWVVLSMVVGLVTEQPFATALQSLVFEPVGTTATGVDTEIPSDRTAKGYTIGDDGLVPAPVIHMSAEIGAGGLRSTVDDLYRLDRALGQAGLLRPATLALMKTAVQHAGGIGYGLGLFIAERWGRRLTGHSGGTFGFAAYWSHYDDGDTTVIVLANIDNGSAERLEHDLGAATFGLPYRFPGETAFIDLPPESVRPFTGRYRSEFAGRRIEFNVALEDGGLVVRFPLLPRARLRPLTPTRFFTRLKGGDVTFEFETAGGRATGIAVDWSGHPMRCPRVD